jgi:hypothetical protein
MDQWWSDFYRMRDDKALSYPLRPAIALALRLDCWRWCCAVGQVAAWQDRRPAGLLMFGLGCIASGNRSAASAQRRAAGAER